MTNIITDETRSANENQSAVVEPRSTIVFAITDTTMRRIFSQPKPGDAMALYSFLCMTANRQQTSSVYALEKFIGKGLGWGRAKVEKAKRLLRQLGLIETVIRRNNAARKTDYYVKVNFLQSQLARPAQFSTRSVFERQNASDKRSNADNKKETGVFASLQHPISSKTFKNSNNSKPQSVAEVLVYALTRCQLCATSSVQRWVKGIDFRYDAPRRTARQIIEDQTDDVVREVLAMAFRFLHWNNCNGWQIRNNWRAAFNAFSDSCYSGGFGEGPADVPRHWVPHIAGMEDWPHEEAELEKYLF